MVKGLRKGDGDTHLISFYPSGGSDSSKFFHNNNLLDFNMRQNSHSLSYTERYHLILDDYNIKPTKPIIDAKPIYEDHPMLIRMGTIREQTFTDLYTGIFIAVHSVILIDTIPSKKYPAPEEKK